MAELQSTAMDVGVHSRVAGSLLILTLNRPDKGNALRAEDTDTMVSEVTAVDGADSIRAIVIRAEGRTFCAGADLVAANASKERQPVGHMVRALHAGPHKMIETLWHSPVPTICAVQGPAMGLGLHLAAVCDFTLASPAASFIEPFCRRGFSVDSGGSFLLPRLIGVRRARQLLFRGITLDAHTAAGWGLIDEVVAADALDDAALALATELAAGPTFSLGHTKELLNRPVPGDLAGALRAEADSVEATIRSSDFKEGIRSFVERRQPEFTGH